MTATFYFGQQDYVNQMNAMVDAAYSSGNVYFPLKVTKSGDYALPSAVVRAPPVVTGDLSGALAPSTGKAIASLTVTGISQPAMANALTSLVFDDLAGCTGGINVGGENSLATLGFPALTHVVGSLSLGNLPALTSLDTRSLKAAGAISLTAPLLATLDLGALTSCGALTITTNNLSSVAAANLVSLASFTAARSDAVNSPWTSISFPLLSSCGAFSISYPNCSCPNLSTIYLPSLATCTGSITLSSTPAVTTLDLSSLSFLAGGLSIAATTLPSLSLPAIVRILGGSSVSISGATNLVNFSLGSGLKQVSGDVVITNCALNQSSVDGILASLYALDGTNGTTLYGSGRGVLLNGGTSSAPSSAGTITKNHLINRGVSVTTN